MKKRQKRKQLKVMESVSSGTIEVMTGGCKRTFISPLSFFKSQKLT